MRLGSVCRQEAGRLAGPAEEEDELYAVIGSWPADTSDEQQFGHIVSVVRQHPGFISGYWGRDTDQPGTAHAVVILDSRDNASAFAAGVKNSIATAQLSVAEIIAQG